MRKRLTDNYDAEIKINEIYKQVLADLTIASLLFKATKHFGRLKKFGHYVNKWIKTLTEGIFTIQNDV